MSIFAGIDIHRGWLYASIQSMLAGSAAAMVLGLSSSDRGEFTGWALGAGVSAVLCAAALIAYMRRLISRRLAEVESTETERRRLLDVDPITGVFARRRFLEDLQGTIGKAAEARQVVLLLVDLDHFKQINDSFGHQFGDHALARLGTLLREAFPDGIVGRLGGDEFAVAVPKAEMTAVLASARDLQHALSRGLAHSGINVPLSVSIGISASPEHDDCPSGLLKLADLALYQSKAAGRSRATVFDPDMTAEQRHRRTVEREVRAAVYLNELELHYQPVVDAEGSQRSAEALVRWRHSVRGLIPPSEFIPIAERSRLIDIVGEWVFRRACAEINLLECETVSVNVSGEQLKRDEVVHMFRSVLADSGCRAERFVLEITESVAMGASAEALERLKALRAMGFRIALDDFGTGHCGFNYLSSLPVDIIKVDRSYVRELRRGGVAAVFVSALSQISRMSGLTILAEGVENEDEFELARAAGCTRFQGYYFGRPKPATASRFRMAAA